MAIYDELKIDWNGDDLEDDRASGDVTMGLDGLPDFGLLNPAEDRQDHGALGMYPWGIDRPTPRQIAFYSKGTCDPAITDAVTRYRALKNAWNELRDLYSPRHGHALLGVTTHTDAGADHRREILARSMEAPSFRLVRGAERDTPGARMSYFRYLHRLEALWPWWRGAEQSVAFATGTSTTLTLPGSGVVGDAPGGWRIRCTAGTGSPTTIVVTLGTATGQNVRLVTIDSGASFVTGNPWEMDWYHTRPQDWFSYLEDGSSNVQSWGPILAGQYGNAGLLYPGDTQVTIVPDTGTITGTFYYYDWYEDCFV